MQVLKWGAYRSLRPVSPQQVVYQPYGMGQTVVVSAAYHHQFVAKAMGLIHVLKMLAQFHSFFLLTVEPFPVRHPSHIRKQIQQQVIPDGSI